MKHACTTREPACCATCTQPGRIGHTLAWEAGLGTPAVRCIDVDRCIDRVMAALDPPTNEPMEATFAARLSGQLP